LEENKYLLFSVFKFLCWFCFIIIIIIIANVKLIWN